MHNQTLKFEIEGITILFYEIQGYEVNLQKFEDHLQKEM